MSAVRRALARRAFADARVRTFTFAGLFALMAYIQPAGYRTSFPTLHDRLSFARTFGDNKAIRLFYGTPHDLLSAGGYSAWRVGGTMAIVSAVYGMLAAVRAMRAEEESGRRELVLASAVTRTTVFTTSLAAIAAGAALLWVALFIGFIAGALPVGGSAYLALACVAPLPVFVGVGAVASQVAPTRRIAIELSGAVLAVTLLLRVVADTSPGAGWLRWATPLGWAEELRAFASPEPLVLLLPLAATAALLMVAGATAARRELGAALLAPRDSAAPRTRLLVSTTRQALRAELGSLVAWSLGIGGFALTMGAISHSFTNAHLSAALQRQLAKVGGSSVTTPSGALSLYFLFFVLAISLFMCAQVAATRREEADGRLETLFALPVARERWLGGRLALALAGGVLLALVAGLCAWIGAATQGGGVSLADMLAAGANCLPASLLFLAVGGLLFAVVPRAASGAVYGLVAIAFLWQLIGELAGVPSWTLSLSPFHDVGLVPAQSFKAGAAVAMLGLAAAGVAAALWLFRARDLTGS